MGNYLQSLRVPPPTPEEDERNHPLYYDWSIPKYNPFRQPASKATAEKQADGVSQAKTTANDAKQSNGNTSKTTFAAINDTNNIGSKTLHPPGLAAKSSGTTKSTSGGAAQKSAAPKVVTVSQTGAVKSLSKQKSGGQSISKNATNTTTKESNQKSLKGAAVISQAASGKAIVRGNDTRKQTTTGTNKASKSVAAGRSEPATAKSTEGGERGKKT